MSADTAFEIGRLYAPIRQIADIIVAGHGAIFHELPGLAGYYPMGMTNSTGGAVNHTGGDNPLTQVGTVPAAFDGNAYRHLGNGINYLSSTGAYGLTGTETWITASLRGLTLGAWFMIDTSPSGDSGLMSRDAPTTERGYALTWTLADKANFRMSGNGASVFAATSPPNALAVWHFIVGRFIPSTEVAVFIDGDKSTNTSAIPVSCNVSTQAFEIGRFFADDTRVTHAKCRDAFICQSALSDEQIENVRLSSMPAS